MADRTAAYTRLERPVETPTERWNWRADFYRQPQVEKLNRWQQLKAGISTAREMPLHERGANQGPLGVALNDVAASVPLPEDAMAFAKMLGLVGRAGNRDFGAALDLARSVPGVVDYAAEHPFQTLSQVAGGPAAVAAYRRMTPLPARAAAHAVYGLGRPLEYIRPEDALSIRTRLRPAAQEHWQNFMEGHLDVNGDAEQVAKMLREAQGRKVDETRWGYVRQQDADGGLGQYYPAEFAALTDKIANLVAEEQRLSRDIDEILWQRDPFDNTTSHKSPFVESGKLDAAKALRAQRDPLREQLTAAREEMDRLVAKEAARRAHDAFITEQGVGGAFVNHDVSRLLDEWRLYQGGPRDALAPPEVLRGAIKPLLGPNPPGTTQLQNTFERLFDVSRPGEDIAINMIRNSPTYRPYVIDAPLVPELSNIMYGTAPYAAAGAAAGLLPAWMRGTESAGSRRESR